MKHILTRRSAMQIALVACLIMLFFFDIKHSYSLQTAVRSTPEVVTDSEDKLVSSPSYYSNVAYGKYSQGSYYWQSGYYSYSQSSYYAQSSYYWQSGYYSPSYGQSSYYWQSGYYSPSSPSSYGQSSYYWQSGYYSPSSPTESSYAPWQGWSPTGDTSSQGSTNNTAASCTGLCSVYQTAKSAAQSGTRGIIDTASSVLDAAKKAVGLPTGDSYAKLPDSTTNPNGDTPEKPKFVIPVTKTLEEIKDAEAERIQQAQQPSATPTPKPAPAPVFTPEQQQQLKAAGIDVSNKSVEAVVKIAVEQNGNDLQKAIDIFTQVQKDNPSANINTAIATNIALGSSNCTVNSQCDAAKDIQEKLGINSVTVGKKINDLAAPKAADPAPTLPSTFWDYNKVETLEKPHVVTVTNNEVNLTGMLGPSLPTSFYPSAQQTTGLLDKEFLTPEPFKTVKVSTFEPKTDTAAPVKVVSVPAKSVKTLALYDPSNNEPNRSFTDEPTFTASNPSSDAFTIVQQNIKVILEEGKEAKAEHEGFPVMSPAEVALAGKYDYTQRGESYESERMAVALVALGELDPRTRARIVDGTATPEDLTEFALIFTTIVNRAVSEGTSLKHQVDRQCQYTSVTGCKSADGKEVYALPTVNEGMVTEQLLTAMDKFMDGSHAQKFGLSNIEPEELAYAADYYSPDALEATTGRRTPSKWDIDQSGDNFYKSRDGHVFGNVINKEKSGYTYQVAGRDIALDIEVEEDSQIITTSLKTMPVRNVKSVAVTPTGKPAGTIGQYQTQPETDPAFAEAEKKYDSTTELYMQYSAGRKAAADQSYLLAQKEIELLKQKCPECTDISPEPVAVPGTQGFYTVTFKKSTAESTTLKPGELTKDEEAAVNAANIDKSCAKCVAAIVAMYRGMEEAGAKGEAKLDTVEERVETINQLFNVAAGVDDNGTPDDPSDDTVKLVGGLNALGAGSTKTILTKLADGKSGFIEDGILGGVCATNSDICSKEALAGKIQEQLNTIQAGRTFTTPGKVEEYSTSYLPPAEKAKIIGVTEQEYQTTKDKVTEIAFSTYNKEYVEGVESKPKPLDTSSWTEAGINNLMSTYNPFIHSAENVVEQAKADLDAAREKARGASVDSEAMFAYSAAIKKYNEAAAYLEQAKAAKEKGDLDAIQIAAQMAERKANESKAIGELVGTVKRSSESGLKYVPLPAGPVAPVKGGLALVDEHNEKLYAAASPDYQERCRKPGGCPEEDDWSFHYGQDWAPASFIKPEDRTIVAPTRGKYVYVGDTNGFGDTYFAIQQIDDEGKPVIGSDGKPRYIGFGHARPDESLKEGQIIEKGQTVGRINGDGTEFGKEVENYAKAFKVSEDDAYQALVEKYTDSSGKWTGPNTYPHLHMRYTIAEHGADAAVATDVHELYGVDVKKGISYDRGQAVDPSKTGGMGTQLTINFDEYAAKQLEENPPAKSKSLIQRSLEVGYSVMGTVKKTLFKEDEEENSSPIITTDDTGDTGVASDTETIKPERTLADTASCIGGALSSFSFGSLGGCLTGGDVSSTPYVSPDNTSSDQTPDETPDTTPVVPAPEAQTLDLTVKATTPTKSGTNEYRFKGELTRTVSNSEDSYTDLQKNFGVSLENRLNIDYSCNGTTDLQKTFTLPYRSFSTQDSASTLFMSEYLKVTRSGSHCFFFEIDVKNALAEENENNNQSNKFNFTVE